MRLSLMLAALLVASAAGKGKKHKHQKPGRAVLDRLSGTVISALTVTNAGGLYPPPLDVAPYSVVVANASCGDNGAEDFCRDTPGKRGVVCDVCEGLDGSPSRRHPAALAVDGDPSTWWQSPTQANGEEFGHIELVATLPAKMELLHVIIKSGPSPRPLAWSLEISPSETNDDWRMVRAFGDRDHCKRLWDLRPERRRRKARGINRTRRSAKPTCSTQFASPRPLENGEMHVAIGEGVSARRVRVSLRASHPSSARQKYYTVRELTLAARCLCHGHADRCTVGADGAECICMHGTCGVHCQRCCAGGVWRPATPCDPLSNQDCFCGPRGNCSYDDSGAIICVNCTDNRAGPLCDRCLFGYYNALPDGPCVLCECDQEGSDGSCQWDKNQHRVQCNCNKGYTGNTCDTCVDAKASFPNCVVENTTPACRCDPRGITDPTRVCDEVCNCKANVVGERCDNCAPGHYGLSLDLPAGCRPCYCSHVADTCTAEREPGRDMALPLGDAWLISDWEAKETYEPSIDDQGKPFLISYEVEGWENYYWLTNTFNGDQLSSYGGEIRASLFWGVARGDSGGSPTVGPDVVLVAADRVRLAYVNTSHEIPGQLEMVVNLTEGSWYTELGDVATRSELMDVLSDVRTLMIRASFHIDQDEVRLGGVEVKGAPANVREHCSCPAGYAGAHCERCSWTHVRLRRAPSATPSFECVPCACNMHAGCRTVDGPCGPCQHNTTGPHCERCLPGHYGNPVQGACKPCACPLYIPTNNFSPNCALASAEGDDFVCTQCPDGYTGDHCELCDVGFWGSPTTPGGSCQSCACAGAPCHADSGLCLVCPPHTEGARCDQCQEGYWFGGSEEQCVACACGRGALSAACDPRTGRCACAPGWQGRACDVCAHLHGDVAAGCPACRCGTAALSHECEALTGDCACAPGAAPPHCDICLPAHYALSESGCLGCNCSNLGSESNACDIRTGQCRCKPHVTGRACDTCEEGYWGLEVGGCRRCECGTGAAACDPITGACACAAGVGGPRCDRCLPGYYGFGPAGCLRCPACGDGRVCSAASGRCVCPARTRGPGCANCARGYWGRAHGCLPCACGLGALSRNCDPVSGQCECRSGWSGRECSRCAPGHFGPRCRPCGCASAGTRCRDGVCPCDDHGRCPCKENVVGDKCDACLEGTFGLSEENPSGCTACFCFGRSAQCTQAEVTRAALHAPAPLHITLLQLDSQASVDQDSLLAVHTRFPDATISIPQPPVPVYVELGDLFLGDRVMSYGGALRFTVEEEGGEELAPESLDRFPLVRLYGRSLVMDYYERVAPVNGTHAVWLHESLWRVRGRGAASRGALMLLLQGLTRVLLRVSTRAPTANDPVHVLLLKVSLETAVPGLSRGAPALGVERCDCPRPYADGSCQRAAPGFWIPPVEPRSSDVGGTIVIDVDTAARPCSCNGRAASCNPDTGHCLNCTGGTDGPQCERCAPGYFGSPDTSHGCQPCACPTTTRNFANTCALHGGVLRCRCMPGYAGGRCEVCAPGYVRTATGACTPCACNARGAVTARCDARARCRCRPHVTGERCDRCSLPRHYLDDDGCRPCDNCTQTLLDAVEGLTSDLRTHADVTELSRVPQPFPALREFAHNTTALKKDLIDLKNDIEHSRNFEKSLNETEKKINEVLKTVKRVRIEAVKREKEAQYLSLESMSWLEEILKQRRLLGDQVSALDEFARGEKHLSAHRAIKEARHLLKNIKELSLSDYMTGATDVSDSVNLQSTSVHEYKYRIEDLHKRLHKLQSSLDQWERKAEELPTLTDAVFTAGDRVASLRKTVTPRLSQVRDVGLRCRLILEDILNLSTNNLTDETRSLLLQTHNLAVGFPALKEQLAALTEAAEEKEGILYNLTPTYKQKYLEEVEKHAAALAEKAKEYKSLFAGTRAVASAGVQAARAWADVADAVSVASAAATDATSAAAAAAELARGPNPLMKTAEKELKVSKGLKTKGTAVLARADELRKQLEQARRGADVVSVTLRALGWKERALGGGGTGDGSEVREGLSRAGSQADGVFARARALYDEASELRRRVRYQLRRRLADLQRLGDTALGAAQEHVSQIRGNTLRGAEVAEALAAAAAARAREHSAAASALDPALASLKQRVARARHAAGSISVSVTSPASGAGCARAFSVSGGGSVTRLALAVSFDRVVRNGTLFMLQDLEAERYMKLSVEKERLRLAWNVGVGQGFLVHPEPLVPTHDDADHMSYRIEVERVWSTVRLKVERAGETAVVTTNSTGGGDAGGTLQAAMLWLGEEAMPLPGCVHALHADDHVLGLWAFTRQPSSASCVACTHRWYSVASHGEPAMTWFGGAGYAELRRAGLRPSDRRHFSLSFTFRTRDENALLFMALDEANNRSVSVELVSCRVQFRVVYGRARLEITAGGRHCDGRPAHVQAIRVFAANKLEKGSLRVNGEETLGSPTPPVQEAAELPEPGARFFVGGAPPGAEVTAPPLLGCLGAVTVDRQGYDLMDTPYRHGLERSCGTRTLRSAILDGDGYIEMPSPALRRRVTLGLTFRTSSSTALLMLRAPAGPQNELDDDTDGDDKHYLAVALIEGEVEVVAAAGKGELRQRFNGTKLNDGSRHVLRLVRAHKQIEVWVDEEKLGAAALAGGGLASRPRGFFIGGAPRALHLPQAFPTALPTAGLAGTVEDFIVDSEVIGLEGAVHSVGARLGRAQEEPRVSPAHAMHMQPDAAHCSKTSSYTVEAGAAKFGDVAGSHATLKLPSKGERGRGGRAERGELLLALHFRTFAPDGLLLLLPGSKAKPKHYMALMVREGKLKLIVRGRRRRELSLAASVADGSWRSVSVRLGRSRLVLESGGAAATARAPPLARASRLYVGGLPSPTTLPHLPNNVIRVGGFLGCIRRVGVNGRAEDLVRDAQAHRGVGQCFPNVERGAYFAGDAHAVWASRWWGEEMESAELSLQFRTTAPSGLLAAAGEFVLEVKDGAVVLSVGSARTETRGAGGRAVCDGAWHAVRARVWRAAALLALDGGPELPATTLLPATLAAPLHLAGLPDGAESSENRENFKGCIRNVTLSGQARAWRDMEALHNVLLDSCPTP
ncbi:laminin subunit alpha-1 [Battus philenor]|uniref:laminin subunit alpha-1 n=1 Tax=Battus philenor TaxID=42288 RepID=UPI0035CEBEC3